MLSSAKAVLADLLVKHDQSTAQRMIPALVLVSSHHAVLDGKAVCRTKLRKRTTSPKLCLVPETGAAGVQESTAGAKILSRA